MRSPFVFAFALSTATLGASTVARADCAEPRGYQPQVTGNQVTICPTNPDSHAMPGCPAAGGMLRVDTATGTTVQIPDICTDGGGPSSGSCYVDECAPPGSYQYGYGTPYQCCMDCCGTDLAVAVTVTQAVSGCAADAGEQLDAGSAPWGSSLTLGGCNYESDSGSEPSDEAGPGPASDASAGGDSGSASPDSGTTNGDAGDSEDSSNGDDGGGCTVGSPWKTEHSVVAIDALALAFGISALARRRPKR